MAFLRVPVEVGSLPMSQVNPMSSLFKQFVETCWWTYIVWEETGRMEEEDGGWALQPLP